MKLTNNNIYQEIKELLYSAKNRVYQTINITMTQTYFQIGKRIVEEEQGGEIRAEYGSALLKNLSSELIKEFGKGYSEQNLKNMRQFYLIYQKRQTVSSEFKLSWSHYIFLTRIENIDERNFYEIESIENSWSLRELKRQFDSGLFERLKLSSDKQKVKELSLNGQVIQTAQDLIKDPYILEFVGLPELSSYSESELEQKLIDKLEHFLLELGKGFTFVARQKRITIDEKHFKVDLVFYNRLLKSFVVIDLKIGELKHQDIGQMMMYVNYFDRFEKTDDENSTIGIILCKDKSKALVELTLPKDNNQIYASKYLTILPNKEEFKKLLEDE
ncbi:PDDEXK nuclease domain-containing protein [Aliarcobacter cryaerophilus]|uniref:PDDEXK nuclease domain-containing protein n=2 Tax=unclassified Arcobacter TaxID=2593671 RepID=A0AA96CQV0_9BACT|nr:PDDEXK nuclease domain-containing protein [Arcobacter sp. AZ-2023]WPD09410.1 PDDEXK nuclease domain-containing protein [Arcobacter sp. DSM 115954]WNL14240.1 PDDEXK nuclease domain-containing protein [Arcobacter sp. AZ-2023]WNL19877.1 PDDEXK nuclease domain-containing protein [Arcobacter sp. AZ-2023]WNL22018.1 PDDEXK nuclease domain-containing protein [Arcobacter sp. AZ-2023]